MPELPEVETTRRGLEQSLNGERIVRLEVREPRLRWPVPPGIAEKAAGHRIESVDRRAKYLLMRLDTGTFIIHLGMSGSLRLRDSDAALHKHDHVIWHFAGNRQLRLRDPRRFGALLWTDEEPEQHPLIAPLGPEPLASEFDGHYLYRRARGRRASVKAFVMDGRVVVGLGNIYATEALYRAGIDPRRQAGRVSLERYRTLAGHIRDVLRTAIETGGTTLRDYYGTGDQAGGFSGELAAYGRAGRACHRCGAELMSVIIAQRSTVYCRSCQR